MAPGRKNGVCALGRGWTDQKGLKKGKSKKTGKKSKADTLNEERPIPENYVHQGPWDQVGENEDGIRKGKDPVPGQ